MRTSVLLLAVSLLFYGNPPASSELEVDRVCGYGTARCRRKCKARENRISRCPNTYPCCLKVWPRSFPSTQSSRNLVPPSLRPSKARMSPEQLPIQPPAGLAEHPLRAKPI